MSMAGDYQEMYLRQFVCNAIAVNKVVDNDTTDNESTIAAFKYIEPDNNSYTSPTTTTPQAA